MRPPEIHYARSGEVAIAYQLVGEGPLDVVFVRAFSGDLLSTWEQPLLVRHVEGLASCGRLMMLDKRGTGLSDRVREVATLEARMDDIRAVMDDAGSESAVLWTGQSGTGVALLFAATYPERTAGLMLLDPRARATRAPGYPWAPTEEEWRRRLAEVREQWGRRAFFEELLREWAPEAPDTEEFRDWWVAHMRRSLSPGAALALFRMEKDSDVTDVLPAVRAPTLIIYRASERGPAEYVAERIPSVEMLELPRLRGVFTWLDDETHAATVAAWQRFAAGLQTPAEPERVLTTLLFTDLVGSTRLAASLGDGAWRELLSRHHALVRDLLVQFRGQEVDSAGDGVFATFDGPARAIRCAFEIGSALGALGLEVRAGVHTGECELVGHKVAGIAVNTGARVAEAAAPGEVLVSSTVKDLVAGSGIEFEDRGDRELKGVPGSWRLYAVTDA